MRRHALEAVICIKAEGRPFALFIIAIYQLPVSILSSLHVLGFQIALLPKQKEKTLIQRFRAPLSVRSEHTTVAFEDVPLGSGGSAVPLRRSTSRQCVACAARNTLIAEEPPPAKPREMAAKEVERVQESLEDRDPNNLNQHVQIVWDDIIGEPEGARSPECAWRLSNACFSRARNWCYTLLAVIIAPPCALVLGCGFACLAFEQIWCTGPCVRCAKIYFASLRTMVQSCMAAIVVPTAEAVGHMCRHIRVNWRKDAPEEKDFLVV